jgi:glycosyltransferase involved in cell wall biosynthesis
MAVRSPVPPSVSVIVSTYNSPRALALVFAGLSRQTLAPTEVLVADDGSGPETRALVEASQRHVPWPLRHVWHADEGFRKCAILNKAILAACGEYLVFFDGDCVPTAACLATHVAQAQPRRYVTGGAVMLDKAFSDSLTVGAVTDGILERVGWWWLRVSHPRRLVVSRVPLLRVLMDHNVPRQPGWRGGNASTFAANVREVCGFDERFGYGYEDADFGHRLNAAGVRGVSVRYRAPVLHVYHADRPRPYVRPDLVAANRALYDANRAARVTATPYGLSPDLQPRP